MNFRYPLILILSIFFQSCQFAEDSNEELVDQINVEIEVRNGDENKNGVENTAVPKRKNSKSDDFSINKKNDVPSGRNTGDGAISYNPHEQSRDTPTSDTSSLTISCGAKKQPACNGGGGEWDLFCNEGCNVTSARTCWGSCAESFADPGTNSNPNEVNPSSNVTSNTSNTETPAWCGRVGQRDCYTHELEKHAATHTDSDNSTNSDHVAASHSTPAWCGREGQRDCYTHELEKHAATQTNTNNDTTSDNTTNSDHHGASISTPAWCGRVGQRDCLPHEIEKHNASSENDTSDENTSDINFADPIHTETHDNNDNTCGAKKQPACNRGGGEWDLHCNAGCNVTSARTCWGSCSEVTIEVMDEVASIEQTATHTATGKKKVVLLGDSNTAITYDTTLGITRWSDLVQNAIGNRIEIVNNGVGNQRASDFRNGGYNWPTDGDIYVLAFTVNDVRIDFHNPATARFSTLAAAAADFNQQIRGLINEIRVHNPNAEIILMSAVWADVNHYSYDVDAQSSAYAAQLRQIANSSPDTFMLDIHTQMREANAWDSRLRRGNIVGNIVDDAEGIARWGIHWYTNIHFNQAGNSFVAESLIELLEDQILD